MKERIRVFLARNWFKISFLVIVVAIAGGAFYWYEWRPMQIRKECSKQLQRTGSLEARELFYKTCLRGKGIEK
ncbi:MAG: hypothetical protein Q8N65_02290 [bacterium]|nr:hypothetical protein [bacterium]